MPQTLHTAEELNKRRNMQNAMRQALDILTECQLKYGNVWPTVWPGVWPEAEAWAADQLAKAASHGLACGRPERDYQRMLDSTLSALEKEASTDRQPSEPTTLEMMWYREACNLRRQLAEAQAERDELYEAMKVETKGGQEMLDHLLAVEEERDCLREKAVELRTSIVDHRKEIERLRESGFEHLYEPLVKSREEIEKLKAELSRLRESREPP